MTDKYLPTRPESNWQLLKRSLVLYKVGFSNVFFLALIFSFFVFLPRFLTYFFWTDVFALMNPLSPLRLLIIVINIICIMLFVAILWRMHCENHGYHEGLMEDIRIGLRKMLQVFVATIIVSAIMFALNMIVFGVQFLLHYYNLLFNQDLIGTLLTVFVFVGQFMLLLYVSILFIFLAPLIAIENKGVISALEKSVLLSWNHWWLIFSLQIIPWLVYLIILWMLRNFLNINVNIYFIDNRTPMLWASLLQFLIFALLVPWIASLLLVQLKDLELRKHLTTKGKNAL